MADPRLQLAYDSAKGILKDQQASLEQIRTRTVSLLSAAALFVSFSAALGLVNTNPDRGQTTPAWVSFALMAVLIVLLALVICVLWPVRRFALAISTQEITRQIEEGLEEDEILRRLTAVLAEAVTINSYALRRKSQFSLGIVSLVTVAALLLLGVLAFA